MKKYLVGETGLFLKELRRFKFGYRLQIASKFINVGILITILFVLSVYLYKIQGNAVGMPLWGFLIPVFLATIFSFLKPIRNGELASKIDRGLSLKERFITSLNFIKSKDAYVSTLISDTINRTKSVKVQSLFPVKWSRLLLLLSVLVFTLLFYHTSKVESVILAAPHDEKINYVFQEQEARIKQLIDSLENDTSILESRKTKLIQKLENVVSTLSETIGKQEALLALNDASSFIESLHEEAENEDGRISKDIYNSAPSDKEPVDFERNAIQNVLDSISRVKEDIVEVDMEKRGNQTQSHSDSSLSGGLREGGLIQGGGKLSSSDEASISKPGALKTGAGAGRKSTGEPFDQGSPKRGVIKNYQDSVISLEALPKKYHKTIIRYFNAISQEGAGPG